MIKFDNIINPFNPALPASPIAFVGRAREIGIFETQLSKTMHGSPMNLSVVGNRGIGKTSLLRKFEDIAKRERCLAIRFSAIKGQFKSVEDLSQFLLDQIFLELSQRTMFGKLKRDVIELVKRIGVRISIEPLGDVDVAIKKNVIQNVLRQKLIEIWKASKNDIPAIVFLIDEAETLEEIEGALMYLREVFSRIGEEGCGYMLVLCGKLSFPDKMSEVFSPLARFFPPVRLKNLNEAEMRQFMNNQLSSSSIKMHEDVMRSIMDESEGHPYVLVLLCYCTFEAIQQSEREITMRHYQASQNAILASLEEFFNTLYVPLSPKAKMVFRAAAELNVRKITSSRLAEKMNVEQNEISVQISELVKRGCLNKIRRGEYEIFHGLFTEYVKRQSAEL